MDLDIQESVDWELEEEPAQNSSAVIEAKNDKKGEKVALLETDRSTDGFHVAYSEEAFPWKYVGGEHVDSLEEGYSTLEEYIQASG